MFLNTLPVDSATFLIMLNEIPENGNAVKCVRCVVSLLFPMFGNDVIVLIVKDVRRIRHLEDSEIEILRKEN